MSRQHVHTRSKQPSLQTWNVDMITRPSHLIATSLPPWELGALLVSPPTSCCAESFASQSSPDAVAQMQLSRASSGEKIRTVVSLRCSWCCMISFAGEIWNQLWFLRPEDVSVPEEDCGEADACLQWVMYVRSCMLPVFSLTSVVTSWHLIGWARRKKVLSTCWCFKRKALLSLGGCYADSW